MNCNDNIKPEDNIHNDFHRQQVGSPAGTVR